MGSEMCIRDSSSVGGLIEYLCSGVRTFDLVALLLSWVSGVYVDHTECFLIMKVHLSLEIKFEKLIVEVSSLEHLIFIRIVIYKHMLLKVPV